MKHFNSKWLQWNILLLVGDYKKKNILLYSDYKEIFCYYVITKKPFVIKWQRETF